MGVFVCPLFPESGDSCGEHACACSGLEDEAPWAFRVGYLGGPAAGWEPSTLGSLQSLQNGDAGRSTSLGAGWTLAISLALKVSCGLGLMLRVRQHFLSCSTGLSSHSSCVGTFWISLKEIAPHVAMYLVPLRELGSLFLSLIEVLYDYPIVYLMSVLALCSSLLRPSESWSCYATYCRRSPVGSNIVFSVFFFFNLKCLPSQAHGLT